MRVTVLGSCASYPGAGQACAGHLVEGGGARVLLDCGHGVVANLGRALDPTTLDAVIISHAHVDHFADVLENGQQLLGHLARSVRVVRTDGGPVGGRQFNRRRGLPVGHERLLPPPRKSGGSCRAATRHGPLVCSTVASVC